MLQRIQSVYFFIVVLLSVLAIFLFPLYTKNADIVVISWTISWVEIVFIVSGLLALYTIFKFKNRKFQFVLARLNIILNLVLLGVFVYWSLTLSGGINISEKGIKMLLPVASIVFLVLANKAVKRDEDLVKSVDRLR